MPATRVPGTSWPADADPVIAPGIPLVRRPGYLFPFVLMKRFPLMARIQFQKISRLLSLGLLLCVVPGSLAAADPAEQGELLFSDDFERSELGDWQPLIPSFAVHNGVLRGWQTRVDHGAVGRVYRLMKDVIVEFKFKLDGSTGFNAVFDDKNHKGSHAGHICRVAFAPKQIRLGDDKEGIMRNDIYEMRKDPAKKKEADQLLIGRGAVTNVTIDPEPWHSVTITILGDHLHVTLDGKPVGDLKSPGIAHETKQSFHFTVNGPGVLFDDVRIRAVK